MEEVWSFRLSQLSAFVTLAVFAFFLIAVTAFIIIKTPIRNYLPGYLDGGFVGAYDGDPVPLSG
mgnify:CR=1 FL=1